LAQIKADGFYKAERVISTPQASQIRLSGGPQVLNFCANSYLGSDELNHASIIDGGRRKL